MSGGVSDVDHPISRWALTRPRGAAAAAAALFLATLAVFWPVLGFDFLDLDDPFYVTANGPVVRGLTLSGLRWAFAAYAGGVWQPLIWLSHMLDCQLYGLAPAGHHLTNLLLHAANAGLLLWLVAAATGSPGRAALAAGLFALHPLRAESVAWVSDRKDLLGCLFLLLACSLHVRNAQSGEQRGGLLPAAAYALALMTRASLAALPLGLLCLDLWPLDRARRRRLADLLREKAALFLLAGAACALTLATARAWGIPRQTVPFAVRALYLGETLLGYLRRFLWPQGLAFFYPYPGILPGTHLVPTRAFAAWAAVLGLTAAALALARRLPYVAAGWLWFLTATLPTAGLVQFGLHAAADRYTYISQLGLALAAAWGLSDLAAAAGLRRRGAAAGALLLLALCAALTRRELPRWRSSEALYEAGVRTTPADHRIHNSLGVIRARRGLPREAREEFLASLAFNPGSAEARNNLANLLAQEGRTEEACAQYEEALRRDPSRADVRYNLGLALARRGRIEEARRMLGEAIRLRPADALLRRKADGLARWSRLAPSEQEEMARGPLVMVSSPL